MIEIRVFLVLLAILKSFANIPNFLCGLIALGAFSSGYAWAQTCPVDATGSCTVSHPTPGCDTPVCCALVCAIDQFCCLTQWDSQCAFIAQVNCSTPPPVPCGSSSAGLCTVVHPTPSCSDAACCESVCAVYAFCCSVSWDQTCVSAAFSICGTSCTPPCPTSAMAENEPCATIGVGNSPCVNGAANTTLLTIQSGKTICGSFRFVDSGDGSQQGLPDLDAYKLVLPDPNGDGLSRVSIDIQAEYGTLESGTLPVFVALLSQPCLSLSGAMLSLQTSGCLVQSRTQCMTAGTWYVVVARGTFPTAQPFIYGCEELQNYNLKVSWDDVCSNPCGSSGDCFDTHNTPGCQISTCCNSVCAIDPVCCQKSWDQSCVDIAISQCSPPVPANDQCSQATIVSLGQVPFTLVAATSGSNPIPLGCIVSPNVVGRDVWYRLKNVRGSVTVRTCGIGSLNTALVIYPYPCSATSAAIACNDNTDLCTTNPSSALVNFTAQCGSEYLMRVASINGSVGAGMLSVTSSLTICQPCPGDYNTDGLRSGSDLAVLLSAWGTTGADINGDNTTNGNDLAILLSGWGVCP